MIVLLASKSWFKKCPVTRVSKDWSIDLTFVFANNFVILIVRLLKIGKMLLEGNYTIKAPVDLVSEVLI